MQAAWDLEEATIASVQAAYRGREVSARQVVQGYLDRIAALDAAGPQLNAVVTVSTTALEEADELDRRFEATGDLVGPLHGVPVLVKDQAETAGLRTTFGNQNTADYVPAEDATAVARLKAAGAIILGKTSMPDFATSWFSTSSVTGVTKNPYDLSRDPGGSSSGTGTAIAANLALVGIGEDTGGSIRLPSSFCSLVGVRVTPGLISRRGMSPLVTPQDTAGPMTRTVADAAALLDVLVGFDPADDYTTVARHHRGTSFSAGLDGADVRTAPDGFGAWSQAAAGSRGQSGTWFDRAGEPVGTLDGVLVEPPVSDGSAPDVRLTARSDTGELLATDLGSGEEVWRVPARGTVLLVRRAGSVVVASGQEVRALDLRTGAVLWASGVPGLVTRSGSVTDGATVVLVTEARGLARLVALDLDTGVERWEAAAPGVAPLSARRHDFAHVGLGEVAGRPVLLGEGVVVGLS